MHTKQIWITGISNTDTKEVVANHVLYLCKTRGRSYFMQSLMFYFSFLSDNWILYRIRIFYF